jgi:hypothetical protein
MLPADRFCTLHCRGVHGKGVSADRL